MSEEPVKELSSELGPYEGQTFEGVVARYSAPLLRFFQRRLGDLPHAENLLQETLLRVFRFAGSYRRESRFSPWMYAIAVNLWRDFVRRRQRAPDSVSADRVDRFEARSRGSDPESAVLDREVDEALCAVLSEMPSRHREVFVLKHQYGLTYGEIARVLRINEGTAKSRMHKATRLVIAKMERRGFAGR